MSEQPVRPWRPRSSSGGYTTASKLSAEDIGFTLQLQAVHTQLSERTSWPGPAWAVVGELLAVSHRAETTSIVLRVAGNDLRLDVDPTLEIGTPPQSRL